MTCARAISTAFSPPRVHSPPWRKPWEQPLTRRYLEGCPRRAAFARLGSRTSAKLAVALLFILALAACSQHADDAENKSTAVPDVTVAKVERAAIADTLIVSGNLAALPNRD